VQNDRSTTGLEARVDPSNVVQEVLGEATLNLKEVETMG
jgi:hypothetical protein